jgi:hypothetical protein
VHFELALVGEHLVSIAAILDAVVGSTRGGLGTVVFLGRRCPFLARLKFELA